MKKVWLAIIFVTISWGHVSAQLTGDVLGSHNFSSASGSPVTGPSSAACLYCHAPHSGLGGSTPLWSQQLSVQSYAPYSSTTLQNKGGQPIAGGSSSLCLSCHDGTVAVGQLVPQGTVQMTGSMRKADVFGTDMQTSHPFSVNLPLKDSPNLVSSLAGTGTSADPLHKVKLVNGNVECNTCHEPHQQNADPVNLNFLVRDGISGQLCLSCHETNPRTVNAKTNPLQGWTTSIHALSVNNVAASAKMGAYSTVAQFACSSCHVSHNANGGVGLLRSVDPPPTNVDASTVSCMNCHNGGSNLQQPIANVYAETTKATGHPLPSTSNPHDANEPTLLSGNRHATCADCHNPHSSNQVITFGAAPDIRGSQLGTPGISAADGITATLPATKQYETCLRCHGTGEGKQALPVYGYAPIRAASAPDQLNIIPQFATSASSSHPVTHPSNSPWPQPSLLPYMLNLDGITNSSRTLGSGQADSILCTDCHNSDDNREFGGTGANGPHGSQYSHVLERRYEYSQVAATAGPGTAVQNLFVAPSLNAGGSAAGPYALCGKCHNLSNILTDFSFKPGTTGKGGHFSHISEQGFSCSVCHTSHGNGAVAAGISGERLVNFDLKVVAPNGATPVSYNHATNTCTLQCHTYYHNSDGTVTTTPPATGATLGVRAPQLMK